MQKGCSACSHDPACGFATIGEERYCHTDDHSCYEAAAAGTKKDGQDPRFFDMRDVGLSVLATTVVR